MNKIFIYYSNSGSGETVAKKMEEMGYDIRRIVAKHKMPKSFVLQMFVGGFLSGIKHASKLKDFNADVKGYDEIAIGSPIWNGKLCCPVNGALKELDLNGKKVRFILYAGGGAADKTKALLETKYSAQVTVLKEPKKYPEELSKI